MRSDLKSDFLGRGKGEKKKKKKEKKNLNIDKCNKLNYLIKKWGIIGKNLFLRRVLSLLGDVLMVKVVVMVFFCILFMMFLRKDWVVLRVVIFYKIKI